MGSPTIYNASCPAITEGFQEKARDNNVWGTRAHEAELEMLRHLVADSTKYDRNN